MMFYFGRYFMAGSDPQRRARFNSGWRLAEVRFSNRLITCVWGSVYLGELIIRIALIYHLSAATVLIISPILLGALTLGTMIWTFSYGHHVRLRAMAQLAQASSAEPS
jgi:hypothetical protein